MKNKIKFLGIIALVVIAGLAVSCEEPTQCDHNAAKHVVGENCGSAAKGCKPYDYGGTGGINGIPVYRLPAVSDAQMTGVFDKILGGYDLLPVGTMKDRINTINVTAIHVTNDVWGEFVSTNKVIKISRNLEAGLIRDLLQDIATDDLAMLMQQNGVRLAVLRTVPDTNVLQPAPKLNICYTGKEKTKR